MLNRSFKRPTTTSGFMVFIAGSILVLIGEYAILYTTKITITQIGLLGLIFAGFIIVGIGVFINRQFYVDNYNEMNPRDIIRNH